jgi:DtxR family Mn-dependent transcriptional regulator
LSIVPGRKCDYLWASHKKDTDNCMVSHKTSESEEMYLVTLVRLIEQGAEGPIPVSLLAGKLEVLPVSVHQMVRKLEEAGLTEYTPYKGVTLTDAGWNRAKQVLRLRRLWEVFLVERLGYSLPEAEALACGLEHALPAEAGERLSAFLGHPVASPSGAPIPPRQGDSRKPFSTPLAAVRPGESILVTDLSVDPTARSFLFGEGIAPGRKIRIQAIGAKGALLVITEDGHAVHLSSELVDCVRGKGGEKEG